MQALTLTKRTRALHNEAPNTRILQDFFKMRDFCLQSQANHGIGGMSTKLQFL